MSPEKAARMIVDMVQEGIADSPQDAVDRNPKLQEGLEFIKEAAQLVAPDSRSVGKKASTTRTAGSGSVLLRR